MLVAVDILTGQSAVAIGITAAPALSLLVVPFAFARRAKREGATVRTDPVDQESGEFSFRSGAGFAAAVLVIMFSEQAFINAGPLITGALKGSAEVGYIFNVLMLARAPLQLFQSVSTSILPHLTSLHASKEPGSDREFARTIRMVLIGIGAFTALVLAVVLVAGPRCMQIAFGKSFTYDRLGLVLVSIGMGLYLASVTINQACTAQGKVQPGGGPLDHLLARFHRLELRPDRRRPVPSGRGRLPALRGDPARPSSVGLRGPTRAKR